MKFDISFFISVAAILVMFYCLAQVLRLRRNIPGGVVVQACHKLIRLVIDEAKAEQFLQRANELISS